MKKLYLEIKSELESLIKSCTNKIEALRIISLETSKLFKNYKNVYTEISPAGMHINTFSSHQLFPTVEIKFYIESENNKSHFSFEIFLSNEEKRNEKEEIEYNIFRENIKTEDVWKVLLISEIIEKHIGKIEKSSLKEYRKYEELEEQKRKHKINQKDKKFDFFEIFREKEIVYDLMPFKVKNVLVIASVYDAFTIESEGNLSQKILGDFLKLNLTTFPKIKAVSSYDEAKEELTTKHFDLIIYVIGNNKIQAEKNIKLLNEKFPMLPLYLLINNNNDTYEFLKFKLEGIVDNIFVWNGDSRIFFTIIKLLEDKMNLESDYHLNRSRIILLVEDTPRFYSKYLPELYMIIFEQVKQILSTQTDADDVFSLFYLRTRPKILHVHSFEEAQKIIDNYNEIILSLITDVEFFRNSKKNENAGTDLVKYFKTEFPHLQVPIIIQSSDYQNKEIADKLDCSFIYKQSETLVHDIRQIVKYNMGFGDFIYKTQDGHETGLKAHTFEEFIKYLDIIPDESLYFHAFRNHFSLWLKARGEFNISEVLTHIRIEDFEDINHLRSFLKNSFQRALDDKYRGRLISYKENISISRDSIYTLSSGALGGKGRGLYFINKLIYRFKLKEIFIDDINFETPLTFIIGTDTYDEFLESNRLNDFVFENNFDYKILKQKFIESNLNQELLKSLESLLDKIDKPLIVRSSGLSEDSMSQTFTGIFETIILTNNHPDKNIRLKQLTDAIKLVYASVFSEKSRKYFSSIDYKIEEEKMAVIIQELVGSVNSDYFYPHFSGTAQSYNFYPYSYLKPEDGLCSLALGLGKYIDDGERCFIFSPRNPQVQNASIEALTKNSQSFFYAIDLKNKDINLLDKKESALTKLNVYDALKHGTLKFIASVYDQNNKIITAGVDIPGQLIINFDSILKYKYIPLVKTINTALEYIKKSMAAPVEIEFAVDLTKDKNGLASFYLLQIKPHLTENIEINFDLKKLDKKNTILYTDEIMGNGIINDTKDLIIIKKDKFDKSKTEEMALELEQLNKKIKKGKKKYVLIVPGRLGTRDKWLGIPVVWRQIDNAAVIVETNYPDFPIDLSSGSHFFHQVVSMQIGYFSVNYQKTNQFINYELLNKQQKEETLNFFEHIKFEEPLKILMNGKKGQAVIELTKTTKK